MSNAAFTAHSNDHGYHAGLSWITFGTLTGYMWSVMCERTGRELATGKAETKLQAAIDAQAWCQVETAPAMVAQPAQQQQSRHFNAFMHHSYNRENYPFHICNNGNWDICANESGYCAAIPTDDAARNGCLASHFGDAGYTRATLGVDVLAAIRSQQSKNDKPV